MIRLASVAATAKGEDICSVVMNTLSEREVDLSKIVSVTTDGVRSMT